MEFARDSADAIRRLLVDTLRIKSGRIPAVRDGRVVRFDALPRGGPRSARLVMWTQ